MLIVNAIVIRRLQVSFTILVSSGHLRGQRAAPVRLQKWTADLVPAILDSNGLRLESYGPYISHRIYIYAERRLGRR